MPDNTVASMRSYFQRRLERIYPEAEAVRLTEWAFEEIKGWPRHALAIHGNERLTESEVLRFVRAGQELQKQRPIQYVFGTAPFLDMTLRVNEHVLIPRPETEELVAWILEDQPEGPTGAVIDLGTGSGCIALALKKHWSQAAVSGLEYAPEALEVARQNGREQGLNIDWRQGDMCHVVATENPYEVIVSNPPYITRSETDTMDPHVLQQEPHTALFAPGEDPLFFYRCICQWALQQGTPDCRVYVETSYNRAEAVRDLLAEDFEDVEIRQDLSGNPRMVRATQKRKE